MFSLAGMPSTSSVLSVYTTFAASTMLVRTVLNEVQSMTNHILPKEFQDRILSKLGFLVRNFSSEMSLIIDENKGYTLNQVYEAAEVYLRTKVSPSVERLKVCKAPGEKKLSVSVNKGEKIPDTFEGMQLVWKLISVETQKTTYEYEGSFTNESVERRSFELTFNKKFKDAVLNTYLPYVIERANSIKEENKAIKLYTLGYLSGESDGGPWGSINLEHPSTFDTLAMDPEVKKELIDDLDRFVRRRHFYKRVGKAWKRGYLLYGPPGTGKSSLIAAMANHLKFDVYDMELTSLQRNSDLRRLLVSTKNRSILVIEDIDCSIDLKNRQAGEYGNNDSQLTLSGLLNFIDGLWSSCGDERIIVFTTNYKDRLDPALLRPGRMDKHIHMSYCTPSGFKILGSNYLGLKSHCKFSEIEKLIAEVQVTPAEVAEELMKHEDPDTALVGLISFLQKKRKEFAESNGRENEVKEEEEKKVDEKAKGKGARKLRRSQRKRSRKCRI